MKYFLIWGLSAILGTVWCRGDISRGPYLQGGTTDSMSVMWRTDNVATGVVEYGLTTNYGAWASSSSGILHSVILTGLSANTLYHYRVSSDGGAELAEFRTFPAGNEPLTFALLGDSRHAKGSYVRERNVALANWQAEHDPRFVLHTGDIVDNGENLTNATWQMMFDDYTNLMAGAPMYISAGNHEYYGGVLSPGYLDNFDFPTNGPDSKLVYSFDCGVVHVTVANIHNAAPVDNTNYYCPGSDQFAWITNDLATTDKPWKIFMVHNPAYSSGKYCPYVATYGEQSTNIVHYYVPELEQYGVNLFVNGHDHLYERSMKSNTTYMTLSMLDEYYSRTNPNPYQVSKAPHGAALCSITNDKMYVTVCRENNDAVETVETFIITNASESFSFDSSYTVPFSETFETNPVTMAGATGTIQGQHGWVADPSDGALVQTNQTHGGSQSGSIEHATLSHAFSNASTNVWITLYSKPLSGTEVGEFSTNAVAVFWINSSNQVVAYSNSSPIALDAVSVQSNVWTRFVVNCDYGAQAWSLWKDGTNIFEDFGFYSSSDGFTRLSVHDGQAGTVSYVDDIHVGLSIPTIEGDTDKDGLPDAWEMVWWGNLDQTGTGDYDIDGLNNEGEWIAGTVPTNSASLFEVGGGAVEDNGSTGFVINWDSVSNRLYRVSWCTNLVFSFSVLASNLMATPPQNSFTDITHSAENAGFYRIDVRKETE